MNNALWDRRGEVTEAGTMVKKEVTSDVGYDIGTQQEDGEESTLLTEDQSEHKYNTTVSRE